MSILYQLFGIVRTFDDFVNQLKRQNAEEVNMQINSVIGEEGEETGCILGYDVLLQTSSDKIRLGTFYASPFPVQFGAPRIGARYAEAKALSYVAKAAETVRNKGLNLKVNESEADKYLEERIRIIEESTTQFTEMARILKLAEI